MISWLLQLIRGKRHNHMVIHEDSYTWPINKRYQKDQEKIQALERLGRVHSTLSVVRAQIAASTGGEQLRDGDS